ncbi:MAG: 50S ribosomal protein L23 [Firmicutes bacterium]|nr:50S ribosomal protein L23 [Candidatus Fermentithermobacillaceae bacterium]
MNLTVYDIIIRPLVTEKTSADMEKGTYTFEVHPLANKAQIKEAVETIFKVSVDEVRTLNLPGKPRRMGYFAGRTPRRKKAIVKLAPGQRIKGFEGV